MRKKEIRNGYLFETKFQIQIYICFISFTKTKELLKTMTTTIPLYVFYIYNIFKKINTDFYDSIDRDLEKTSRRLEHLVRLSQLRIDLV